MRLMVVPPACFAVRNELLLNPTSLVAPFTSANARGTRRVSWVRQRIPPRRGDQRREARTETFLQGAPREVVVYRQIEGDDPTRMIDGPIDDPTVLGDGCSQRVTPSTWSKQDSEICVAAAAAKSNGSHGARNGAHSPPVVNLCRGTKRPSRIVTCCVDGDANDV
jgi:hypothetical protein